MAVAHYRTAEIADAIIEVMAIMVPSTRWCTQEATNALSDCLYRAVNAPEGNNDTRTLAYEQALDDVNNALIRVKRDLYEPSTKNL